MPAWNLADLMSRTTAALGNRSDLAASDVSFWVNEAYDDVWNRQPHDLQETIAVSNTTVNEDKITLPTDFAELVSLSNTSDSNRLLDPLNVDQLLRYPSTTSGIPRYYAEYNSWLELRPIPDSAYSLELRYRKLRSDLTSLTARPSVTTHLRRAIFLKAVELLADNVTLDDERAVRYRQKYEAALAQMPSDRAMRMRENHALGMSLGRSRGAKQQFTSLSSFDRRID